MFSRHIWSTNPNFKAVILLKERLNTNKYQSSGFTQSAFCTPTCYSLGKFFYLMFSFLTIEEACSSFLMEWFCELFCLVYIAAFSWLKVFCRYFSVFFQNQNPCKKTKLQKANKFLLNQIRKFDLECSFQRLMNRILSVYRDIHILLHN